MSRAASACLVTMVLSLAACSSPKPRGGGSSGGQGPGGSATGGDNPVGGRVGATGGVGGGIFVVGGTGAGGAGTGGAGGVPAFCGDGFINRSGEVCDDGNAQSGDGCTAECSQIE